MWPVLETVRLLFCTFLDSIFHLIRCFTERAVTGTGFTCVCVNSSVSNHQVSIVQDCAVLSLLVDPAPVVSLQPVVLLPTLVEIDGGLDVDPGRCYHAVIPGSKLEARSERWSNHSLDPEPAEDGDTQTVRLDSKAGSQGHRSKVNLQRKAWPLLPL